MLTIQTITGGAPSGTGAYSVTELLAPTSVGTGTTYDITSISQDYDDIILKYSGVSTDTTNRAILVQPGVANSFGLGVNHSVIFRNNTNLHAQSTNYIANFTAGANTLTWEGELWIRNYSSTTLWKPYTYVGGESTPVSFIGTGMFKTTSAINALQIYINSTGNLDAGTAALYGISYG